MGAKIVLFIESTKLFDGKLFFDIDSVAFLSLMKELYFHLRALNMQYIDQGTFSNLLLLFE